MGDSLDLITTMAELRAMQIELRNMGKYKMANVVDFALSYLMKYQERIQKEKTLEEFCEREG